MRDALKKMSDRRARGRRLAKAVEELRKSNVCWKVIEDATGKTERHLRRLIKPASKQQKS